MNQYPGFGGIFLRQWADQAVRIPARTARPNGCLVEDPLTD
jgi:hypothetical protein